MKHAGENVVRIEADALRALADRLAGPMAANFDRALDLLPVDALHGDLGMVVRGDVVLALSASGETEEILQLLATIKRLQVPLIAMTCEEPGSKAAGEGARSTRASTLASSADVALDCSISQEACSLGLAPTASTTTMLALG